jgi:competence protein ComEA
MSLPGIGQAKAEAIVAYREEHGFFGRPEELKKVSGIGDGIYKKLESKISV